MKAIERKQIILIKLAVRDLKIPDDKYREILNYRYWQNSCTKLTFDEATDLINFFVSQGFKIQKKRTLKKKLPPDITQLPSPQILAAIGHLRQDVKWRYPDGYQRWLKKYMGIERPRTMKEAMKIYEGLKAMRSRQQRASEPEATCYKDGYVRGNGRIQW